MKLLLILVPVSFVIGLALGFYLYIYLFFPLQLETFTNIIPFTSISSLVVVIINMIREWNKNLHLKFGEIFKENDVYFLKVLKVRGEKSAEDCEGYLTTKDIDNYVSVWRFDSIRVRTIMNREDLRLFEHKDDKLIFPSATSDEIFKITNVRFGRKIYKISDYINENLTVIIASRHRYKLETTLLISDILSCKNPNKSHKEQILNRLNIIRKK
jgi:hypothetical protein